MPDDTAVLSSTPRDAERSRAEIEMMMMKHLRVQVAITVTDNRRTMLSAARRDGMLHVRMHHMFLWADDETVRAMSTYFVRRTAKANRIVGEFISANNHRIRDGRLRRAKLRTAGAHHDLHAMHAELNAKWFEGAVTAPITWGKPSTSKRRYKRSIRLGTYSESEHLIRIHPALDQDWVPDYVITTVIFHEMLHAVMPAVHHGSKKVFHTREFRKRERAFPDYARATEWENKNLARLLKNK